MDFSFISTYEFWIFLLLGMVAAYLRHEFRALSATTDELKKGIYSLDQRQRRLSATYMKIENDIQVLNEYLFLFAERDPALQKKFKAASAKGRVWLSTRLEHGPVLDDVLRGLEFPDLDKDPFFSSHFRPESYTNHLASVSDDAHSKIDSPK